MSVLFLSLFHDVSYRLIATRFRFGIGSRTLVKAEPSLRDQLGVNLFGSTPTSQQSLLSELLRGALPKKKLLRGAVQLHKGFKESQSTSGHSIRPALIMK